MVGGIAPTQEMLDFCAEHGIGAEIETISADGINEAYDRVVDSDVRYRFVIDAATWPTDLPHRDRVRETTAGHRFTPVPRSCRTRNSCSVRRRSEYFVDVVGELLRLDRRREPRHHRTRLVDEEFGEIPFDPAARIPDFCWRSH